MTYNLKLFRPEVGGPIKATLQDEEGGPERDVPFDPKPQSEVMAYGSSRNCQQVALVTSKRVDPIPSFGTKGSGAGGVRRFTKDDQLYLVGGSASRDPGIGRRVDGRYVKIEGAIDTSPGWLSQGDWSDDTQRVLAVYENYLDEVRILKRNGAGKYVNEVVLSSPQDEDITWSRFSPAQSLIFARGVRNTKYYSFNPGAGYPEVQGPPGLILAISSDDVFFVVSSGENDAIELYKKSGNSFTHVRRLLKETTSSSNWVEALFASNDELLVSNSGTCATFVRKGGQLVEVPAIPHDSGGAAAIARQAKRLVTGRHIRRKIDTIKTQYNLSDEVTRTDTAAGGGLSTACGATISEDGSRVAFGRNIYTLSGGQLGSVRRLGSEESAPRRKAALVFAPNTGRIASIEEDGTGYLWVGNSRTRDLFTLRTTSDLEGRFSRWSRDSSLFVHSAQASSFTRVEVVRVTGTSGGTIATESATLRFPGRSQYGAPATLMKGGTVFVAKSGKIEAYRFNEVDNTLQLLARIPGASNVDSVTCAANGSLLFYRTKDGRNVGVIKVLTEPAIGDPGSYASLGLYSMPITSTPSYAWAPGRLYAFDLGSDPMEARLICEDALVEVSFKAGNFELTSAGPFWNLGALRPYGGAARAHGGGAFVAGAHMVMVRNISSPEQAHSFAVAKGTAAPDNRAYVSYHRLDQDNSSKTLTFSPDGNVLHVSATGWSTETPGEHFDTPLPPGVVKKSTSLPFLPEGDVTLLSDVNDVQYSPSGEVVTYANQDDYRMLVKDKETGEFIDVDDGRGTFVQKYELQGGKFVEVDFKRHAKGTVAHRVVFSPSPIALSYHLNEVAGVHGQGGRWVHNSEPGQLEERGRESDGWEMRSYVAFGEDEIYFAATYDSWGGEEDEPDDRQSEIRLYKFTDIEHNYIEVDRKEVPFGPVDMSKCDGVVVGHPGAPPFTIFDIDRNTDKLKRRPDPQVVIPEGETLKDIKYVNCGVIAILTDKAVITAEEDPEQGGIMVPGDRVEREPKNEEEEVEVGEDGELVIGEDGEGPPPDEAGEDEEEEVILIGDGDTGTEITDGSYPAFSAVNVFYRT